MMNVGALKMKFKAMLPALVVTAAGMSVQVWAADDAVVAVLETTRLE